MELLNTLVIDSASTDMRDQFIKLIEDNSFIVFIAFNNDATAQDFVERADFIADDHQGQHGRKIIWIQDRTFLQEDTKKYLATYTEDIAKVSFDDILGFVLSPRHHEAKFVFVQGDDLSDLKISKAFWKASLREREVAAEPQDA